MSESNPTVRLEAFCDGVFAIALTLLIIDIKLPHTAEINSNAEFWVALKHITPSIVTFVLSFTIILITWVSHHNCLKLVNKTSPSFIYSNGLLLLSVVFMPYPTALLGDYILTDHAAPAIILFNGVIVVQALGWVLLTDAAIKNQLTKNEKSTQSMKVNRRNGYFSV